MKHSKYVLAAMILGSAMLTGCTSGTVTKLGSEVDAVSAKVDALSEDVKALREDAAVAKSEAARASQRIDNQVTTYRK